MSGMVVMANEVSIWRDATTLPVARWTRKASPVARDWIVATMLCSDDTRTSAPETPTTCPLGPTMGAATVSR